jgi:hypothetical protein
VTRKGGAFAAPPLRFLLAVEWGADQTEGTSFSDRLQWDSHVWWCSIPRRSPTPSKAIRVSRDSCRDVDHFRDSPTRS